MIEYKMTEGMTQNKSVWHLNTKAGALLHGGDMYYVGLGVKVSMKMQTFKNKQTWKVVLLTGYIIAVYGLP